MSYHGYYFHWIKADEEGVLAGKIAGITDLVTFEADTEEELQIGFERAVDDYLVTCKEVGKEPEKPFTKGQKELTQYQLTEIGDAIGDTIMTLYGPKYGFVLLVMEHGKEGFCNYISSVEQEETIEVLRETAARLGKKVKKNENGKQRSIEILGGRFGRQRT